MPHFLQSCIDWLFLLRTVCELTGSPVHFQQLLATQHSQQYWQKGLRKTPRNFDIQGPPESLQEVSLFACSCCAARYYTDQFS